MRPRGRFCGPSAAALQRFLHPSSSELQPTPYLFSSVLQRRLTSTGEPWCIGTLQYSFGTARINVGRIECPS